VEVDAVSGFLFAVKTEYFARQGLQFDAQYTPCYMEEWDIGLQCRQRGWKCYVVPTTAFDHEWSGSIRALRTIRYMRREETSFDILERNRAIFKQKWERIAREAGTPWLLRTLWPVYGRMLADRLQEQGKSTEADHLRREIAEAFPEEVLR
jgi:GT2 family glycosyltransferase